MSAPAKRTCGQHSDGSTITISQLHTTGDLLVKQAILGDQVRIAQPDLFINRPDDRPE